MIDGQLGWKGSMHVCLCVCVCVWQDFLRSLPNCLLTCERYHQWTDIATLVDVNKQIEQARRYAATPSILSKYNWCRPAADQKENLINWFFLNYQLQLCSSCRRQSQNKTTVIPVCSLKMCQLICLKIWFRTLCFELSYSLSVRLYIFIFIHP